MIFLAYFKEKNHFQFRQVGFVLNNYTQDIEYNELSNNSLRKLYTYMQWFYPSESMSVCMKIAFFIIYTNPDEMKPYYWLATC